MKGLLFTSICGTHGEVGAEYWVRPREHYSPCFPEGDAPVRSQDGGVCCSPRIEVAERFDGFLSESTRTGRNLFRNFPRGRNCCGSGSWVTCATGEMARST